MDVTRRWGPAAVAGVLMLAFALQLVRVAQVFSVTWDEPHHLYDGYTIWTRGDHRLNPEVPPLLKLAAALPLLPARLVAPPNQGRPEPEEAFRDGRAFVFDNGPARTLLPARHACVLFALALAALTGAAAWRILGKLGGLIALTLVTFDPTLLAHGSLVTTDVASALFIFAAVLAFMRSAGSRRFVWLGAAGVLTGCALSTKFTGVLLMPMLAALALWEGVVARSARLAARRLAEIAGVGLLAWAVVWAFYGFRFAAAPAGLTLSPALDAYLRTLPNPADAQLLGVAAHLRLLPEAYLWGLANTRLTEFADTAYLFGHVYRHGPWWYFPAALLIKSTLPLLLLLFAAAVLRVDRRAGAGRVVALLIPVALYLGVVSSSHFDIGVRHLLPIYPFLYVVAAGAATALAAGGAVGRGLAAILVAWQVATCLRAWPAYMAYGNEAWGGPGQVHRYLSDANTDWGQQLEAVKAYLDARHENGDCWFAYFPDGAIEPSDYGVRCRRLPTTDSLWWLGLPMTVPPEMDGTVLISDSDLEGIEFGDGELNPYDALRRLKPDAVIQGGVNVYQGRFHLPLASALVQVREAGRLQAAGRLAEALAAADAAARLAPRSATVQLARADALKALGRGAEAQAAYQRARGLVNEVRPDLQAADLGPRITTGLASAAPSK